MTNLISFGAHASRFIKVSFCTVSVVAAMPIVILCGTPVICKELKDVAVHTHERAYFSVAYLVM